MHIITGLSTGGAERALYNLLEAGLASEFDNYVISLSDLGTIGPRIQALDIKVFDLGMRSGFSSLKALIRLNSIIRKICPDIIQGWMYHGNLVATVAKFFISRKSFLVWNIRQSLYQLQGVKFLTRYVIRLNRLFSTAPHALLYNSYLSRQQHEDYGFSAKTGRVISNGINMQQFSFSKEMRTKYRTELLISQDSLVIGHVARFHPMKDHMNFFQSAICLAKNNSSLHFLLIGKDVTLDNVNIKTKIPPSVQKNFHLLGEQKDISGLMSAMDIFCQSSWSEAFPNVLGEAMAIGLPCVATDVGDSSRIVSNSGLMVAPKDSKALISGLESILAITNADRQKLGELAHKRIVENYNLDSIVTCYTELYTSISLNKRKH